MDEMTPAEKRRARDLTIKPPKRYDMHGYVERMSLKGVRKATAVRMAEASRQTLAVAMDEVDVTELVENNISPVSFMIIALTAGLKEHPYLNSEMNEQDEEIILKKYYNIGVSMETADGSVVPVIKQADQKTIEQLTREITSLEQKAKCGEITMEELNGGTFTLSNIGFHGGTHFTSMPNYPETATLNMGTIHDKPVVVDSKVVVRKVLPLSLTFDHRVIDGITAQKFLNTVMKHLNDPSYLLASHS